jgi:quercetin dioxygenase-like cupin family protein
MDGGDTIQFFDQVYRVKAAGAQTGGSFGLVEVSTPQGSGPPPHVHEREDEAFYVLEGSYEVTVGNDRFDAREGFFIFAPRGIPHGYVVRAAPARHLGFVFPIRECRRHDRTAPGLPTTQPPQGRPCGRRTNLGWGTSESHTGNIGGAQEEGLPCRSPNARALSFAVGRSGCSSAG